ncbi:alpha/beta hydrolase [Nonomuraea antimicrobica]|uniref:Alpha/beta hydrolase n=1 Tax=Nonomuraea antimicrobica TaxID=561173 RepID=A0ABP7C7L2_9ACTN
MPYALDPELAPLASLIPAVELAKVVDKEIVFTPEQERAWHESLPTYTPRHPVDVADREIPGPEGAPPVRVRVYEPSTAERPGPGLLYVHGGGFVASDLVAFDARCTEIADRVGAVVVSVDYRLSPETPFPGALEDTYAALTWLHSAAGELGVDVSRVAVGGDSAGGNLSAAVSLLARDRGGPALCFQFLDVPVLDDRMTTKSVREFVDTPGWNGRNTEAMWGYYLKGGPAPGSPDVSPYAAPMRAEDLTGLPPALVVVCEFDPLRDEGIAYAQRLTHAGVATELVLYPGTFHGASVVADVEITRKMREDMIFSLRRGLRPAGGR